MRNISAQRGLANWQAGFTPIVLLLAFLAVGVLGGGGFYYYNSVYKPKFIKESSQSINKAFDDLHDSADELVMDLKDDDSVSSEDTKELKKALDKTKELNAKVEGNLNTITPLLKKKVSETEEYVGTVEEYSKNAQEVLVFSKTGVELGNKVVDSLQEVKDAVESMQSAQSNPTELSSKIEKSITNLDQAVKDLKAVQVTEDYKDMQDSFAETLEIYSEFLTDLNKALKNLDTTAMYKAQTDVAAKAADNAKKLDAASEKIKDKVNDYEKMMNESEEKVEKAYNSLKEKVELD